MCNYTKIKLLTWPHEPKEDPAASRKCHAEGAWKFLHFRNNESLLHSFLYAFRWGTSSCLQWRCVRNSEVSAGRESSVVVYIKKRKQEVKTDSNKFNSDFSYLSTSSLHLHPSVKKLRKCSKMCDGMIYFHVFRTNLRIYQLFLWRPITKEVGRNMTLRWFGQKM